MKRVLFVDHVNRILGGAEINLVELLDRLPPALGWEVSCACHPGSSLAKALNSTGARLHDYRAADVFNSVRVVGKTLSWSQMTGGQSALRAAVRELQDIVQRASPDVIISCTNKDHFAAAGLHRARGGARRVPCIWWFNDILSPAFFPMPFRVAFAWRARRRATRLVAVSDHARKSVLRHGVPASRTLTIHNGIPWEKYAEERSAPRWRPPAVKPGEKVVGMVGRITPWKGQELFLKMASLWLQRDARTHFVIVGDAFNEDGDFEKRLRSMAAGVCRPGHVHFVPFQADVISMLEGLDVLVHSSTRPEPFGRVIIEAMAAGVPVVASRAGGVPEIITHGRDGLLAEAGDVSAYMEHLGRLLGDATLWVNIQREARQTVRRRFTVEHVRERFNQLINEVSVCA